MSFFDMHTHLPTADSAAGRGWRRDDVLAAMDEMGVARSVVMTFDGLVGDPRPANDAVAAACADSGGRLVPLGSVHPRRPDAADEVRRCAGELGCRAIKLHPWLQGFSPVEECLDPVAEAATETGLPLVVHDGTPPYSSPLQIAYLAERFPDLTVVLAHGGLFDLWRDAVAAVLRHPNLHVTLCGTAPLGIFRQIVALVGPEKISLGTDSGYGDPHLTRHRLAVHRLLLADQDPAAAAAMAHGNAERLLRTR
ncbi:amidohydrolase family protein [Micromonospora cathayae]|uniref:TatD family hydrolase n=1 Tax=Micromonospora cathayae TaxID=3028804 RepID=A0ABY7ZIH5_9ACTN|nr:amidohydrolase family protein [Micromonospora sp. HUAS 3]WDZ82652.1 TatD family hydrolase [Micromonospora sp. HUAS 3]